VAARRPPAVARVLERVTKTSRAHDMFQPGHVVLVSVSGGPDSVCLLYSLWHLRRLFKIRLVVFHLDHRLRPESSEDAAYVRRTAERLKVPARVVVASGAPAKGMSIEAWATTARGNAANEIGRDVDASVLAEGHTLDDQAETVLLNLIRGTGLEGLSGIAPRAGDRPSLVRVQPLIDVERADVENFCRALHLRPRHDPMNDDRRYLRNAVRHDVLPQLERVTGRAAKASIVRTADLLRVDRLELEAQSLRLSQQIVRDDGDGLTFEAESLAALSPALAGRVIRIAIYRALSEGWAAPWSREAIEAVLDLARGRPGRTRDLPEGRSARRTRTHVVIGR
jgi:tRNA(Ile)-lysidine synthase